MSEFIYLACDFSGIQRYVLAVKSAGKAQAKRLRARSFLLELYEHAALATTIDRLGATAEDVLVSGGGGFTVRLPPETALASMEELAAELQRKLWEESGGELQVSMGWDTTPLGARAQLEYRKRRPGASILQSGNSWNEGSLSLPPLGQPCDVCGQSPGQQLIQDEDENALQCENCSKTRRLGERLTDWQWMRRTAGQGAERVLGVEFEPVQPLTSGSFRVGRWIPQGGDGRGPLTFEEMSERAQGDSRLAVLKADVDDMGAKVGQIAALDSPKGKPYGRLQSFSRSLHTFFVEKVQDMLKESWPLIYTIYAGGDDLLLVGPWNFMLDFAGSLSKEFEYGPGREYGPLTLSAGVALVSYRVPIRHSVERGEELLKQAKGREDKNSCAALEAVWSWDSHEEVIGDGKKLARWEKDCLVSRSLLHRLLRLAESDEPARAARWSYQVHRNVHETRQSRRSAEELRGWAARTMGYLESDQQLAAQAAASIRYALLATRGR